MALRACNAPADSRKTMGKGHVPAVWHGMSLTLQPPGRLSHPRCARHPEARPQCRPSVVAAFRPAGTTRETHDRTTFCPRFARNRARAIAEEPTVLARPPKPALERNSEEDITPETLSRVLLGLGILAGRKGSFGHLRLEPTLASLRTHTCTKAGGVPPDLDRIVQLHSGTLAGISMPGGPSRPIA